MYALSEVPYYDEIPAEFSSGTIYRMLIYTTDRAPSGLAFACYPPDKLQIQFLPSKTIFPDDSNADFMFVSVTHRFDTEPAPDQTIWKMNWMEYKSAWYQGDSEAFGLLLKDANTLSIRLDKTNTIYRFSLKGTSRYVSKIINACQ